MLAAGRVEDWLTDAFGARDVVEVVVADDDGVEGVVRMI